MTLVRDTVANFIGGVSQQPDKLMYPNQSKEIVNYLPVPSTGLKDRPPTEHIGYLRTSLGNVHPLVHTILKEDEEYEAIISGDGDIRVFDLEGNEKEVYIESEGEAVDTLISRTESTRPVKTVKATFAKISKGKNKWRTITIEGIDYCYFYYYQTGVIGNIYKSHSGSAADTGVDLVGTSTVARKVIGKNDYYIEVTFRNETIVIEDEDNTRATFYCKYPAAVGSDLYTDASLTNKSGTIIEIETEDNTTYITRTAIIHEPLTTSTYIANYIKTVNPLQDLQATTIADYTFILNKKVITALKKDTYPNPYAASALIFVRQGNYGTDHTITINNNLVADYTTSDTVLAQTKTNNIANELYTNLTTNLSSSDWTITKSGSVICIQRKDGADFTIQAEDSNANQDLYAFYKSADAINTLPTVAPDGFILKIVGEDVNKADDYYVQFETSDGSAFGTGSWKECCSPDIEYKLDEETMPHALIRQANGTFLFKTIDWTPRGAGDEDSAPSPSFIGNTIQDVFTHKGRLAFLSVDKSIYSDTQDIFSFFKKTTTAELDTDPIDVGSNSKMVLLKHSLPFNEELLLFSETSTFSIKGGDVFSNSTAAIDLTMEYPCSRFVKPINAGGTGFFLFENGNYSRVMEIYITSTYSIDARDITEQVPSYLPKNMYKIAGSTANSMACFLTRDETDAVYVYNYYYSSEQKAQSAWSKWKFDNAKILNVDFHDNWLYLTVQYSDGIYLERMNFTAKNREPNLDYLFYLDRKFYKSGTALTVDNEERTTSFTLPYTPVNTLTIVDNKGFPLSYTVSGSTVTVSGIKDYLVVGNKFTSTWKMPLIYYRQQTQNGTKVVEGLLMLRDINLCYADTGHFNVNVQSRFTTTTTSDFNFGTVKLIQEGVGEASDFEFTGKIVGTESATLGKISVSDGTFLIPIISKNDEVEIVITNNSYLPSCFLSLEWLGDFVVRGQ